MTFKKQELCCFNTFQHTVGRHTVDGSEIPNNHLGCKKKCKKIGFQLPTLNWWNRRDFRSINRWAAPTAAIIPDSLMGHKGCWCRKSSWRFGLVGNDEFKWMVKCGANNGSLRYIVYANWINYDISFHHPEKHWKNQQSYCKLKRRKWCMSAAKGKPVVTSCSSWRMNVVVRWAAHLLLSQSHFRLDLR